MLPSNDANPNFLSEYWKTQVSDSDGARWASNTIWMKFLSKAHRDLCTREWMARVGGTPSQFMAYYDKLSAEQRKVCQNVVLYMTLTM
jgi:hypothetical protein